MKYHVTLDIRTALKWPDRKLSKMLVSDDGQKLSAAEAREHLIDCLRQGFDNMPCCDNHDAKGSCKGHPSEDRK